MKTSFKQILDEKRASLPDTGETVGTEERFDTLVYKDSEDTKGKKIVIEPNTEFEVVSNEDQIVLSLKGKGQVRLEKKEYELLGFYLV